MEKQTIFRAGIKRHKGSLFGIALLLFLTTLSLCTVMTVYLRGSAHIRSELRQIGFGELTAWVSGVPDIEELAENIDRQDGIEDVTAQVLVFSEYEGNGVESDSEGQIFPWYREAGRYKFFKNDLSGYQDAPEEIGAGEVYVSPSMVSVLDVKIGDTITFPIARNGQDARLTVSGYYEDPIMGSSMIGMKGFLVSPTTYGQILEMIDTAGIDALARAGAMLHIQIESESGLTVSEINRSINENTSLSQYTEFIHSADAIESFMGILQNAFCGLLAAFALILMGVTFVALGHSISGMIDRDWKNLGILKTIGMTGRQLVQIQAAQYLAGVAISILLGMAVTVPAAGIINRMIITTSGIWIPSGIAIFPCIGVVAGLLTLFTVFIVIRLKPIHTISPMGAIRGEIKEQGQRDRQEGKAFPISAKGLFFSLALRQVRYGKRRYVSACMVAALLVFFASLSGRMNDWLGPDGKGMMDAFNPADLDIGIQVLGELGQEEMEQTVRNYSDITDSYMLAMPDVSVDGTNYTANVITEPERFHISRGQTSRNANEVVLTETVASDLHVDIGDSVTIRGDMGMKEFTVTGIYHCANDMGANLGMSREGYLSIGSDDPRIWCHHYFLSDPSAKPVITEMLENRYGGDVHVHENTWPGLAGIIGAMHILLLLMYGISAVFICIVTVMTGSGILETEQKDLAIYKSIGCSVHMLRFSFAIRFGIVAFIGAVFGTVLAGFLTDPAVSAVMRLAGISNFSSSPSPANIFVPGIVVLLLFLAFAYMAAGKIKKDDMSVLIAD